MSAPLKLPAPCPLCGALLQRINPGSPYGAERGVAPHYEYCHPGETPPEVAP